MIGQSEPTARVARAVDLTPRLPVPTGLGRGLVLLAVFICAACGLVYELELVALANYLGGDLVTRTSIVLSVMVFAMGVGSLVAKRWRNRAACGFAVIEILLALFGGLSAFALYGCFAWLGHSGPALIGFSFVIGVLIGAEVPLLMTLIQRIRRQDPGGVIAELFAADYVGALVGGLAFPFLLLPVLGQLDTALLTGAINAMAAGFLVLWLFRCDLTPRGRRALYAANAGALLVLAIAALFTGAFENAARQAIYGSEVRRSEYTATQEVVLTGKGPESLQLFLDGHLSVSARDEFRYHEALVHPAMAGRHARVLVLGGGDGLALREVLRYSGIGRVTVVEVDPTLVDIARSDPALAALNEYAHRDARVHTVTADIFDWLRSRARPRSYDVVIADLPDPTMSQSAKLYSVEFYELARKALAPGGRLVTHAGSPQEHPKEFWTVRSSIRAVGLRTVEYHAGVAGSRTSGGTGRVSRYGGTCHPHASKEWGFVLASYRQPVLRLDRRAPRLRSLTEKVLRRAMLQARSGTGRSEQPSTLMHPRYFG